MIKKGTREMGFCSKGERLSSTLKRIRTSRDLQQRSRVVGSVDGKLLRGYIKAMWSLLD